MDAQLLTVIGQLSESLANLERTMANIQELLRESGGDLRKSKANSPNVIGTPADQAFLAHQFPRRDGTFPPSKFNMKGN